MGRNGCLRGRSKEQGIWVETEKDKGWKGKQELPRSEGLKGE
jgi:hypothetical protein